MDFRSALKHGIAQLRAADIASYTLAAELLLLHATKRERTYLYSHPEAELTAEEVSAYQQLLDRRASGVPVQHLTCKQEFWGLEFEVTPDVLIPRPETEHLIEVALDRLALRELHAGRPNKNDGEGLLIADVGTGSGCIAVALAKEMPKSRFMAFDVSPAALAVARRNAEKHAAANQIEFIESNLFTSSSRSPLFDLIVSNPPYVGRRETAALAREVRDHEPELALYGGEEGYEFYAELIAQSATHLKPSGLLVLELGHDSLPAVQPLLDAPHWRNVAVTNDLAGIPRVIAGERASVVDKPRQA
ncbi:MAG: peptide chain release factor N(5)-glutamine methyltransferase [Acidobacteria bacterium]|nr:peptide chain release factor N(5)-glutamine methyltransferase [Acidobacteriota bacterium]MBS1864973.1 peptide chain release factor N(5)-glutamine methyltransferase [Acidobacteriota bacterium]